MHAWLQDIRFSGRLFSRNRATTAAAVLALAVGIGASTAVFSVVHGVLLRPLPYVEEERIVAITQVGARGQSMRFSDPNFEDVRDQNRSLQSIAEYAVRVESVVGGTEPVRAAVAAVSRSFFEVFRVRPVAGHLFDAQEALPGAAPTALVSHAYWRRSLGAAADLSALRLRIEGRLHAVIGVLPPGFSFPADAEVWIPRALYPRYDSRTAHNWEVVGRLRDGLGVREARADLSGLARRLAAQYGDDTWMVDASVRPLREALTGDARPALLLLLGAVFFLLLVACANVANLLLAQAAARQRELSIRIAVGAGRGRLVRQLLTEALLLSLAGGAVGVLLARWAVNGLLALEPGKLPRVREVAVDLPVIAFAFAACLVTASAIGLVTALRATGAAAPLVLRGARGSSGPASRRTLASLVLSQVAATVVLLVGASLLGRSLLRLLSTDPGFRVGSVVAMDVALPAAEGEEGWARRVWLHDEVIARLQELPGVREVGAINLVPLAGDGANGTFAVTDHEAARLEELEALFKNPSATGEAHFRIASEGYFRAFRIPLVRGRLFDASDSPDRPHAAVVSESLARQRWPSEDPIGKRVQFGNMDGDLRLFTIVGIVGDVRDAGLDRPPRPTFYANARQRPRAASALTFVVHTEGPPATLVAAARGIVRGIDPDLPPRFRTVEELRSSSVADRRFALWLLGAFAASALALAALGIYGVASYSVARRAQEVGIRMALGAQPREVVALVVGEGARPVVAGAAIGIGAAFALTRLMTSLLYGVDPGDPLTLVGVAALLAIVALAATLVPARRATRVDPVGALRAE
jgi:predicted permease